MNGSDAGDQKKRPRIPENNPTPPEVDDVPLKAYEVPTDNVIYRNMLGSSLSMTYPAVGDFSTVATGDIGDAALLNQLGTTRPPKILPAFSETKEIFYIIPVGNDHPGAIEVTYEGSRASANFYKHLAAVHRLVPEGMRDHYPLKPTPGPVEVGSVKGYGLYCRLAKVESSRVITLSDETKAKRMETRRRNQEKKKGGGAAASGD